RLALDAGVLVLDLLPVRRETRRPPVGVGDDDHRIGLRDRDLLRRIGEVAHRGAQPLRGFRVHLRLTAAEAAAAKSTATPSAAAEAAVAVRPVAAVAAIDRLIAEIFVERPRAGDRRL